MELGGRDVWRFSWDPQEHQFVSYPEAPGAFNGRPDPSTRHPGRGWGSQNQVVANQSFRRLWVASKLCFPLDFLWTTVKLGLLDVWLFSWDLKRNISLSPSLKVVFFLGLPLVSCVSLWSWCPSYQVERTSNLVLLTRWRTGSWPPAPVTRWCWPGGISTWPAGPMPGLDGSPEPCLGCLWQS